MRPCQATRKFQKPVLCVLESDPDKGGTSVAQLRAEVQALECSAAGLSDDHYAACVYLIELIEQGLSEVAQIPSLVEWHREKVLKSAALKVVVASILRVQLTAMPTSSNTTKPLACETLADGATRTFGNHATASPGPDPGAAHAPTQSIDERGTHPDEAQPRADEYGRDSDTPPANAKRGTTFQRTTTSHRGTASSDTSKLRTYRRLSLNRGGGRASLSIRHPLQLRLTGEKAVLNRQWERRLIYVHAAYRAIPGFNRNGRSVFDELCEQLAAVNVRVTDSPEAMALSEVPMLILLCPGIFHNPQLIQLVGTVLHLPENSHDPKSKGQRSLNKAKRLLGLDSVIRAQSLTKHLTTLQEQRSLNKAKRLLGLDSVIRAQSLTKRLALLQEQRSVNKARGLRGLGSAIRAQSLTKHLASIVRTCNLAKTDASPAQNGRRTRLFAQASNNVEKPSSEAQSLPDQTERTIVRLYSTGRAFGFYIAQCVEHAKHLADAGLFNEVTTPL